MQVETDFMAQSPNQLTVVREAPLPELVAEPPRPPLTLAWGAGEVALDRIVEDLSEVTTQQDAAPEQPKDSMEEAPETSFKAIKYEAGEDDEVILGLLYDVAESEVVWEEHEAMQDHTRTARITGTRGGKKAVFIFHNNTVYDVNAYQEGRDVWTRFKLEKEYEDNREEIEKVPSVRTGNHKWTVFNDGKDKMELDSVSSVEIILGGVDALPGLDAEQLESFLPQGRNHCYEELNLISRINYQVEIALRQRIAELKSVTTGIQSNLNRTWDAWDLLMQDPPKVMLADLERLAGKRLPLPEYLKERLGQNAGGEKGSTALPEADAGPARGEKSGRPSISYRALGRQAIKKVTGAAEVAKPGYDTFMTTAKETASSFFRNVFAETAQVISAIERKTHSGFEKVAKIASRVKQRMRELGTNPKTIAAIAGASLSVAAAAVAYYLKSAKPDASLEKEGADVEEDPPVTVDKH